MRALLLLPLLALAGPVHAQIQRCIGPDGTSVFTDRRCEDVGATARLPPLRPSAGDAGAYLHSCPRRLSELVYQLRAAIDARDVNRLSSVYLWSDLSNRSANRVLTQLEAIAERPLVDIAPIYPETEPAAADDPDTPPTQAHPWGLRLEQNLANGSTPSRTVFSLRRRYDCFWVSF